MSDANNIGYGQLDPTDFAGPYNALSFVIQQALGKVRTMVPVKVLSVQGGGVAAAPTVSVQVLVKMVDGAGNTTSHGQIFNIPVFRYQGQYGAIILDPAVNQVGMLVVADRDISSVQASGGAEAPPGSWRIHDLADGVYCGSLFGGTPSQYIWMNATGITIADNNGNVIAMKSGSIAITGNLTVSGTITAGFGGADQVGVQTHEHPTAANGPPSPPTPGT